MTLPARQPLLPLLLRRRLLIVTGKGGVGKSTIAAALAWRAAEAGQRVLACEFDAKGELATALSGAGPITSSAGTRFVPDELHPNLWVMAMDPEASLREYLRRNLHLPFVGKVGPLSSAFDFLANAAPGVREIVTMGKVAWEAKECNYDLVVVDATSTGHIMGQLRAPLAINELVGVGLIRNQTAWMLEILNDPAITGLVVTTTAEETPVSETIELCGAVTRETGVGLAAVIVNRVLADLFVPEFPGGPPAERKAFARLLSAGSPARRRFELAVGGSDVAARLLEAAVIADELHTQQQVNIDHLVGRLADQTAALGDPIPLAFVPQLFGVEVGLPTTRGVAAALEDAFV